MIGFEIDEKMPDLSAIKKKYSREAVQRGLRAAGQAWHAQFLPMHFEGGAQGRYNYKQRSRVYQKRKRKGQPYLVWTGATRDKAKSGATIRVAGLTAKVTMKLPDYIEGNRVSYDEALRITTRYRQLQQRLRKARDLQGAFGGKVEGFGDLYDKAEDYKALYQEKVARLGKRSKSNSRYYPPVKEEIKRTVPSEEKELGKVVRQEFVKSLQEAGDKARFKRRRG